MLKYFIAMLLIILNHTQTRRRSRQNIMLRLYIKNNGYIDAYQITAWEQEEYHKIPITLLGFLLKNSNTVFHTFQTQCPFQKIYFIAIM